MTAHEIIRAVARSHGFSVDDMKSPRRSQSLFIARLEAANRLHRERSLKPSVVGRLLGRSAWMGRYYISGAMRAAKRRSMRARHA
jgi:hypothetical protein